MTLDMEIVLKYRDLTPISPLFRVEQMTNLNAMVKIDMPTFEVCVAEQVIDVTGWAYSLVHAVLLLGIKKDTYRIKGWDVEDARMVRMLVGASTNYYLLGDKKDELVALCKQENQARLAKQLQARADLIASFGWVVPTCMQIHWWNNVPIGWTLIDPVTKVPLNLPDRFFGSRKNFTGNDLTEGVTNLSRAMKNFVP